MTTKKCSGCKEKPLESFARNKRRKDGLQTYCRDCKRKMDADRYSRKTEYHRQYVKEKKKVKKNENLNRLGKYLAEHPCVDCGEGDLRVLDFDHVRGDKIMSVSAMLARGWSWYKIMEEIGKCEVRCSNCHRKRTLSTQGWRATWVGS